MNIVPTHKLDFETCEALTAADDKAVIEQLSQLLQWLQDINWPVAQPIIERIKMLDDALILPLTTVFHTDDGIWKYFVILYLLPTLNLTTLKRLKPEIERLARHGTDDDIKEEVNIAAQELLDETQWDSI